MKQPNVHWGDAVAGNPETLEFLPLVEGNGGGRAGWCTYERNLEGAPDVEIMCGGKNSKLPSAAAIWRQGNLVHFGFQQDPNQLNGCGKDLLVNTIVYAAKFREDRPLGTTRSVFRGPPRQELVHYLNVVTKQEHSTAASIGGRFFSGERRKQIIAMGDDAAKAWIRTHMTWLVPTADRKLDLCPDLQAMDIDVRSDRFLGEIAAGLQNTATASAAARVLQRHVPSGPRVADAAAWQRYLADSAKYLFFSDAAGTLWLVDTLAKKRGVPTAELRGPARAGGASER